MHLTILEIVLSVIVIIAASCSSTLYFIFRPKPLVMPSLELDIPFTDLLEVIKQSLSNNIEQIVITAYPNTQDEVSIIITDRRQQLENNFNLN